MNERLPFPFLVGCPRSGTTLLRAMLDAHPDMAVPFESYFIVKLAKARSDFERGRTFDIDAFLDALGRRDRFLRWNLPLSEVRAALEADRPRDVADAIRRVFAAYAWSHGKARYGDKTPDYVMHIPSIADLFPEALFVHIIRDGRDVALSLKDVEWGPSDPMSAAAYWRERVDEGRAAGRLLGDRYMEVRYEDLVADPGAVLSRLCEFCRLEFDPSMLDYQDKASFLTAAAHFPDSHRSIALPPTPGLRDWRTQSNAQEIGRFELIAGPLLSELAYARSGVRPRPVDRFRVAVFRMVRILRMNLRSLRKTWRGARSHLSRGGVES